MDTQFFDQAPNLIQLIFAAHKKLILPNFIGEFFLSASIYYDLTLVENCI